jgi:hypothetical protein
MNELTKPNSVVTFLWSIAELLNDEMLGNCRTEKKSAL